MNSSITKLSRQNGFIKAALTHAVLRSIFLSVGLACIAPQWATAAALPDGTKLSIDPGAGVGEASAVQCSTGSCFGMEVSAGVFVWTGILPGTDNGLILGKDQASGTQETAPSANNTTSGEITKAWSYGSAYGTFYTSPGRISALGHPLDGTMTLGASTNVFDDAGCALATCVGKTELKVWNTAWNDGIIPMGSTAGCTLPTCSANQRAGIFVLEYLITLGGPWSINYRQVVPFGTFEGFRYRLILRGTHTPAPTVLSRPGGTQNNVAKNSLVTLSGRCTSSSTITGCSWGQISGPTFPALTSSIAQTTSTDWTNTATFTPPNDGTYVFRLTATTATATDANNVNIVVAPVLVDTRQASTSGCSLGQGVTVNPSERFDWWLVLGFVAWLGMIVRRRQKVRA